MTYLSVTMQVFVQMNDQGEKSCSVVVTGPDGCSIQTGGVPMKTLDSAFQAVTESGKEKLERALRNLDRNKP
jgi:L-asparaginase II